MKRHGLPGDIILYPAWGKSALSSRLVVAGEILAGFGDGMEQFSHAAVVSDVPGFQFEATFPKTVHDLIDAARPYEVWSIAGLTTKQRADIIAWCKDHVGRWYNLIGVLTGGIIRLPDTYYCSQFAGFAYRSAGVVIGDSIMSPDSIPDSEGARLVHRFFPTKTLS